jgi:dihydroxyacetone kinase-like protein
VSSDALTTTEIRAWLLRTAEEVAAAKDHLTKLDAAIGDADHGANLDRGFAAVRSAVQEGDAGSDESSPGKLLVTAGRTLISTVGGASGPLYGSAFRAMGKSLDSAETIDAAALGDALRAGLEAIQRLGKAELSDKTMVDAWTPAVDAYTKATEEGATAADAARRAAEAAERGAEETVPMVAHKGRASYLGERSAGHQDPGATSTALLLAALADVLAEQPG